MCTVTYIPTKKGYYLTSNRDEHITRGLALPPMEYVHGDNRLMYPKDPDKGGSWIVVKNNGDLAVLLNGAHIKHERALVYRKSRGLILLEIINHRSPVYFYQEMNLDQIEPFTLILIVEGELFECCWDGNQKKVALINNRMPHIWSSATLYDRPASTLRKTWFNEYMNTDLPKTSVTTLQFHRTAGKGDSQNGLLIDRENGIKTRSITHVRSTSLKITMTYQDLMKSIEYQKDLVPESPEVRDTIKSDRLSTKLKRAWIRIFNWEYWPFQLVYGPVILYWFWLSLRARSLFFFSTSNPLIEYGGFAMESKKKIYDQIPDQYYPKTLFFKADSTFSVVQEKLAISGLTYPVIAKPDIGGRGVQVKLLHNPAELEGYIMQIRVDFLVQEFVNYKNEVGLFYYRIPGEAHGRISGIVGKKFLAITGDGSSTVKELLAREPRYLLQLPVLMRTETDRLKLVLPAGEKLTLVPYGNHARGAEFIDLSHLITPELSAVVDKLCRQVPEFYFGRLDVMYRDWQELSQGKNFSIIELNGAGSEPTHIYDPSHSIVFAWREIIWHWTILYRISKINKKVKGLQYISYKEGIAMLKNNAEYEKKVA